MDGKKYYWLRLKRDFFKRHDIRILEGMPDGKEMTLFYLKLMLEAVDHEGFLRFSEKKPYTVEMLALITTTDAGIAKKALDVLLDLGMVEIQDDGTFFIPETTDLIGFETEWAKQKRDWREQKGQIKDNVKTMSGQSQDIVYPMSNKSKSKSKRKSKSIEKNVEEKNPFGEFSHVLLTDTEYSKLSERFGEQKTTEYIVKLDRYIENYPAKGNKYKSHYATILNWIDKDTKEAPKGIEPAKRSNPYDVDDILNQAAAIEEREKGGNK